MQLLSFATILMTEEQRWRFARFAVRVIEQAKG